MRVDALRHQILNLRTFTVSVFAAAILLPSLHQPAPVCAQTVRDSVASNATIANLPPELEQVAKITGALPVMRDLQSVQAQLKGSPNTLSLESLAKRQKLIYLHQKLIHILDTANLEVNATRGAVESEMTTMQEVRARMVDENARTLRRNTIVNFISGGITKIAGYSIALGGSERPSNILEVFDGSVQCALSGMVLKQLHSESETVKAVPKLLAVLDQPGEIQDVYPQQVWQYLGEVPASSTNRASRRALLCAAWKDRGFVQRREKANILQTGHFRSNLSLARMAPQLLDDRLAMLSELRTTVSEMHYSLMQLSGISKRSYDDAPSFD